MWQTRRAEFQSARKKPVKKSEYASATKRVNAMSKKISAKKSKTEKPLPCYSREDIEAILTNVLLVSASIAAVLLTLSLFITVVRN
jgi:hypothetical protein